MSKDLKSGLGAFFQDSEKGKAPRKKSPRKVKSPVSQETKSLGGQEAKSPKKTGEAKYKTFTKVNYYLEPELVKRIKVLSAKQGRELSDLADEAMRDLLRKHKG